MLYLHTIDFGQKLMALEGGGLHPIKAHGAPGGKIGSERSDHVESALIVCDVSRRVERFCALGAVTRESCLLIPTDEYRTQQTSILNREIHKTEV